MLIFESHDQPGDNGVRDHIGDGQSRRRREPDAVITITKTADKGSLHWFAMSGHDLQCP